MYPSEQALSARSCAHRSVPRRPLEAALEDRLALIRLASVAGNPIRAPQRAAQLRTGAIALDDPRALFDTQPLHGRGLLHPTGFAAQARDVLLVGAIEVAVVTIDGGQQAGTLRAIGRRAATRIGARRRAR